ncbi:hypothetical protein ACN47E_005517 [Coniothyrium glycines]
MDNVHPSFDMPPPPRPTQHAKAIETSRLQTLSTYYPPHSSSTHELWHLHPPRLAHQRTRTQDLYTDRTQTNRQHGFLLAAKQLLPVSHRNATEVHASARTRTQALKALETKHVSAVYCRVETLYVERMRYIQECGVQRMSAWTDWAFEQQTQANWGDKTNSRMEACEATLDFLEDDYLKRKVEFVMEVYALLERVDPRLAELVLADLGDVYEWLRGAFSTTLRDFVVDHSHVRGVGNGSVPGKVVGGLGQAWHDARRDVR